jgi:4a-hydroxytetrahydrobiopterin dehydratase
VDFSKLELLAAPAVVARLKEAEMTLEGWKVLDGKRLEKTYKLKDFAEALALVNRIGQQAEQQNHHPEILLSWGQVRVQTWSHDTGGLTERDDRLAAACDEAYAQGRG